MDLLRTRVCPMWILRTFSIPPRELRVENSLVKERNKRGSHSTQLLSLVLYTNIPAAQGEMRRIGQGGEKDCMEISADTFGRMSLLCMQAAGRVFFIYIERGICTLD